MLFLRPPGVYAPQDDTSLLAAALRAEPMAPGARVLDIGTGTGALAVAAARRGARVTAVDASLRAVITCRINARLSAVTVRTRRGDLLRPVPDGRYDLILSNPPYVPSPLAGPPRRGRARAWEGGHDGRYVLDRICADAPARLRPGGVLLLVQSALSGISPTLDALVRAGLDAEVTERRFVPFGPRLRERVAWLRERGLLLPGEDKEELVVIRAERAL
ncbi:MULTISPECIES: HemK2/MTQ2 family protein methyltransferase [Streptomyces]|uniref:Methyltransferase n=1 Tax=Streptomyces lycii TaxID=2654337 RepID=A0ABQ7FEU6_9ACTN|nr:MULTISPECIES: HemK2/MTQ2 family protein methyltransferase [Streptomyces]KAF4406341.1 methyltransferase [Streptomyces lycii]PGH47629.1 methyltransferase [Streptomyces sp. Ru87]